MIRPILQKNKKAELDFPIITVAFVLLGLLFLAPFILKTVTTILTPFGNALNDSGVGGGEDAKEAVFYVQGVFVNFWDGVLLFAFLTQIILLFVSALFIDTNPFFIILYVIVLALTVIFAPQVLDALNNIYDSAQFVNEVAILQFIDFIRQNFGLILTVIGVLNMIVMYAKVRYFPAR
jgi:hypothetical protein